MRTKLNLDDDPVGGTHELAAIRDEADLVREALKSLVERESARKLAALGGTMPELKDIPRRRML